MKKFVTAIVLSLLFVTPALAAKKKVRSPEPSCSLFFCGEPVTTVRYVANDIGMTNKQLGLKLRRAWCSEFHHMKYGERYRDVADNRAISWMKAGTPAAYGCVGCTAVLRHHVGTVIGYDDKGNPILHSGNHGGRVGIGTYSKHRIVGYRHT